MPKYSWKQLFRLGSFPEVGQKQKTENKEKRETESLVITIASYALQTLPRVAWAKRM